MEIHEAEKVTVVQVHVTYWNGSVDMWETATAPTVQNDCLLIDQPKQLTIVPLGSFVSALVTEVERLQPVNPSIGPF